MAHISHTQVENCVEGRESEVGRVEREGQRAERRTSEWEVPRYCKESPWVLYALRVVNSTELSSAFCDVEDSVEGGRRGQEVGDSGPVHAEDALILMYRDLLRHGCSSPVGRMYVYKYVSQRTTPDFARRICRALALRAPFRRAEATNGQTWTTRVLPSPTPASGARARARSLRKRVR